MNFEKKPYSYPKNHAICLRKYINRQHSQGFIKLENACDIMHRVWSERSHDKSDCILHIQPSNIQEMVLSLNPLNVTISLYDCAFVNLP